MNEKPESNGPRVVPSKLAPWQAAQLLAKRSEPSAACSSKLSAVSTSAGVGAISGAVVSPLQALSAIAEKIASELKPRYLVLTSLLNCILFNPVTTDYRIGYAEKPNPVIRLAGYSHYEFEYKTRYCAVPQLVRQ